MRVTRLKISNFRGIAESSILFEGHTLLVGPNNVGKSTICEAIELVLGPERLNRSPPVQEFDFYNGDYLEDDGKTPRVLRVELVLTDLTEEIANRCANHLEFWRRSSNELLAEDDLVRVDDPDVEPCLRLETQGRYDPEEDEFTASTFYSHSPTSIDGSLRVVSRQVKRLIGFIYLRALRTGSRALSLERGSLLDTVLRLAGIRTQLWEYTINRLRDLDPPIGKGAGELEPVLKSIEQRLGQYIPVEQAGSTTSLFVSQLTREHLRTTLSFFLAMTPDQSPVPFRDVGTGTLNTLVLALLSFIAETKRDNVIFAMEEPEIALPPHTQRRIADYLLSKTSQCLVTSHSPYVIERFEAKRIRILKRDTSGGLDGAPVRMGRLKPKAFRRHARRGLSEAMLGKAVIVCEGLTEQVALWAVAEKMEEHDEEQCYPLDVAGVTVFSSDGDGSLAMFGAFFRDLGLRTYAFYDKKTRTTEENERLKEAFDEPYETAYAGAEKLLSEEVPADHQWTLLEELRDEGTQGIPKDRADEDRVRSLTLEVLKGRKGDGTAARLLELCGHDELPETIVSFLELVYADFPRPAEVEELPSANEEASEVADEDSDGADEDSDGSDEDSDGSDEDSDGPDEDSDGSDEASG